MNPLLEVKDLNLYYGDAQALADVSLEVPQGAIVAIIGANGAGKTSLIRTIAGIEPSRSGQILFKGKPIQRLESHAICNLGIGQVAEGRQVFPSLTVLENLEVGGLLPRARQSAKRTLEEIFTMFPRLGERREQPAGTLSGGERARVALAMIMLSGANLLLFDEPTNHLDVETIEALEDAIEQYDGTVILVSHDRALLRALTNRVWVLHERRITDYPGDFGEWETVSAERAHAAAVEASEAEALRRVHERQQTRRSGNGRKQQQSAQRNAQRAVEQAEARVTACEARIAEVRAKLEDPELYATPTGASRAHALGLELDAAREDLERALRDWEAVSSSN